MKTDQDLIFEAYIKTLHENYSEVDSIFDELESFMRENPETENELSPILNNLLDTIEDLQKFDIDEDNIENVESFVNNLNTVNSQLQSFMRKNPKTGSGLSPILDELKNTIDELDGHFVGGHLDGVELGGIINRLAPVYEAYSKTLNEGSHLEGDESREKNIQRGKEAISTEQELFYNEYGADAFEDQYGFRYPEEDYEDVEGGAVNLLEQLLEEAPELEDKINQILEKVFDAVDILKQERYVDDPQLQKAFDSLIEGDF